MRVTEALEKAMPACVAALMSASRARRLQLRERLAAPAPRAPPRSGCRWLSRTRTGGPAHCVGLSDLTHSHSIPLPQKGGHLSPHAPSTRGAKALARKSLRKATCVPFPWKWEK